jgi:hypothetical protein
MRVALLAGFAVAVMAVSAASAQSPDATACTAAAFADYNKANLRMVQQQPTLMPPDAVIAQRRLEEQYCLRYAQCIFGATPDQSHALSYRAEFAGCLRDESLEKYDAILNDDDEDE